MSTQRIISWRVYKSVSPLATLSAAPLLPAGRRRRNAAVTPPRRRGPAAPLPAARSPRPGPVSQHGPDLQKMCRENQEYLHLGKLGLDESRQDRYMHA